MNPREFCREPDYHTALILTYSFDPLFFERVILPELWRGGTGDIIVIADHRQISDLTQRCHGQLRYLGRRYQLVPADVSGLFHPKIILKIGNETGAICIGSGNVTSGGWGGNRELAASWSFGPGRADPGLWIRSLLERLSGWCPKHLGHDVIRRVRDLPWIATIPATSNRASILLSGGDGTLATKLAARWAGRRFVDARILTGSTDENAAMLRWLHETFGVRHATILVDRANVGFDRHQLVDFPVRCNLYHVPGSQMMHAKFYWLESPEGAAVILGSANCSASAWLVPPSKGGNTESITVYDEAGDEMESLLEVFRRNDLESIDLSLRLPRNEAPGSKDTGLRVLVSELSYEESSGVLRVTINSVGQHAATVSVDICGQETGLRICADSPGTWACELQLAEPRSATTFAIVRIGFEDGSVHTVRCWVNDLTELRYASRGRRIADTLRNLKTPQTTDEQNKILRELQRISVSLLTEPDSYPDPVLSRTREVTVDPERKPPVDPDDLVKSLSNLATKPVERSTGAGPAALSLMGVMRALFELDDYPSNEDEVETADEPELEGGNEQQKSRRKNNQQNQSSDEHRPGKGQRNRLKQQMEAFLMDLARDTFAEHATVTQLVQAAAYPLAVGMLGHKGKWIDSDEVGAWIRQVFVVLFQRRYNNRHSGLFNRVQARYRWRRAEDRFRCIVGDGTLWTALLFGLANASWGGRHGGFQRCLALREVYRHRELLAAADLGRMRLLVSSLDRRRAEVILNIGPRAAALIEHLDVTLRSEWKSIRSAQAGSNLTHRPGDLLWRHTVGWAEALEENRWNTKTTIYLYQRAQKIAVSGGYYINVDRAADTDSILSKILSDISTAAEW